MDYNDIESLVSLAKIGDIVAKEALVKEFTPFILNLSKKSFINSYEAEDIRNECFRTLFKCVNLYSLDKHRFVAYATNAIKNSVNHLIRVSKRREGAEGPGAFVLDGNLENVLCSDMNEVDDLIMSGLYKGKLNDAIKRLSPSEQELVAYVYYKKYSLKKYSELMGIPYSTVLNRKNRILDKLKKSLHIQGESLYLN